MKKLILEKRAEGHIVCFFFEINIFLITINLYLQISTRWIQSKALSLAKDLYPTRSFKASRGWVYSLACCCELSIRRKTNAKPFKIESYLPTIQLWHYTFLQYITKKKIGVEFRSNVDQVPVGFLLGGSKFFFFVKIDLL